MLFATAALLSGCSTAAPTSNGASPSIEPLKSGDVLVDDLFLIWFLPSTTVEHPTVVAQYDMELEALVMRIDGRKEQLAALRQAGARKVGQTFEEAYANQRVRVRIVGVCEKESWNEFHYSGEMEISIEGKSISLPVKGYMTH